MYGFYVLFAYYVIDNNFGEQWNKSQYIRIIGILFVILGTFVYLKPQYFQRKTVIHSY